ncbi:MAG: hypothetical protein CME65_13185 [Halobacteriovoraceae bacterium]|nr:hypothetical protein [Halobacteriovoraceae bacterium]|tara:strand:+ start:28642 stop:29184 length:543 start_codon:yes stop_codon:yes gene_type:complete
MSSIKFFGFIFSLFLLISVSLAIYNIGKSNFSPREFFEIPKRIAEKVSLDLSNKNFVLKVEPIHWPIENETAKVYSPETNPCQIKWIVTMHSVDPDKYHKIYYLNPNQCSLSKEELFVVQFKILSKINQQIDFKHVAFLQLETSYHLDGLDKEINSGRKLIELITGRKILQNQNRLTVAL